MTRENALYTTTPRVKDVFPDGAFVSIIKLQAMNNRVRDVT